MTALEVAASARKIVEAQMADLIRQMTVERGMDPRDFALYAYGGAGGLHVAGYLRELGSDSAVIPLGTLSTTWSAYGCATSDLLQVHERAVRMVTPLPLDELRSIFEEMEEVAARQLTEDGIPAEHQIMERSLEMKYPLQIHQVEVQLGPETLSAEGSDLVRRFTERYEQLYGRGSAWEGAGVVAVVACRVVARGSLRQPEGRSVAEASAGAGENTRTAAWVDAAGGYEQHETRVVPIEAIGAGSVIEGPAIIEADTTTVAVPPGAVASANEHGDLTLELRAGDRAASRATAGVAGA
jgi:N-methylhydantoinase A